MNERTEHHRQEIRRLRIKQERTGDESGVSRTALASAVLEVVGRRAVPRLRGASVAAEAAGQVDVEGVEVEVAHLGEAFGGPGAGQGLGGAGRASPGSSSAGAAAHRAGRDFG